MICDESSECIRLHTLCKIYFQITYRRRAKINESNCNDEFLDSNQEKSYSSSSNLIFVYVRLKTIKFFSSRLSVLIRYMTCSVISVCI